MSCLLQSILGQAHSRRNTTGFRTCGVPVGAGSPAVQTGDIVYIPNRGHGLQAKA